MIRLKIKRVFNNNVVLVYKDDDEAVIFGKGIGYQKKHGDTLDETKIGKIFTTNKKQSTNFETLFNEISTEYVDLTYKIVEQAESDLNIEFNSSIYIAVMDHINYALVRAKENLFIKVRFLNIYYMNFMIVIKKIMIFLFKLICKFIHF